ncbi:MAG: T9SS type A sorting domain-containing protein [Bacteroidetes bacterium]|nr:T9SS type A sorting domain-containing protein [Bacteroidota bacterium]
MTSKVLIADDIKLLSLYPVPLKTSTLSVKLNLSGTGITKLELRNLIGKKIEEKEVFPSTEEVYFYGVDTNPEGVYIIIARNANGKVLEISKFILNK